MWYHTLGMWYHIASLNMILTPYRHTRIWLFTTTWSFYSWSCKSKCWERGSCTCSKSYIQSETKAPSSIHYDTWVLIGSSWIGCQWRPKAYWFRETTINCFVDSRAVSCSYASNWPWQKSFTSGKTIWYSSVITLWPYQWKDFDKKAWARWGALGEWGRIACCIHDEHGRLGSSSQCWPNED